MTTHAKSIFPVLVLSIAGFYCICANAAAGEPPVTPASMPVASAAAPVQAKLAKIVFVGKEHPCDCTRKALDSGWAALQKALGAPAKLPVERLQVDTEAQKVEPYQKQKPFVALPAIYFLDGKGAVVELLQGEVSPEQITNVLDPKKVAPRP